MLIVTGHHRDAKEGKYEAGDSLTCKSEPTDHHMLNGAEERQGGARGVGHLVSIGS